MLYPNAGYNGEVIAEDDLTSNGGYESGDEWSSGNTSQGEPESVNTYDDEVILSHERVGDPNGADMGGGTVAAASGSHNLWYINDQIDQGDGNDSNVAKREEEGFLEGELEVAEEDDCITDTVAMSCVQQDLK